MSLEGEEPLGLLDQAIRVTGELQKQSKISYARDFLLSLSELDVCKKLPSGFDQSLLSDSKETSEDRYRVPGSFSFQSYRRNDHSSSPPTKGDASYHSRDIHGKWDTRSSSGKSDRDSDSLSGDSDSGRRFGNQSRRPWQVSEHDGLLGSGSFPRPSGYVAGVSAPKFRANESYQLNRSKEPYHPPRPYKAIPHSRRDASDSYNDETFGSLECTSEDKAEEERKRRDSFELMRKEQQKAFEEKQKASPEKSRDEFDILLLMEDSDDERRLIDRKNGLDEPEQQPFSHGDLNKPSLTSAAPVSRPLVPPGFSSSVEKNIGTNSPVHPPQSKVGNEIQDDLLDAQGNHFLNWTSSSNEEKQSSESMGFSELHEQLGRLNTQVAVNSKGEGIPNPMLPVDLSSKTIAVDLLFNQANNSSKAIKVPEIIELGVAEMTTNKVMSESKPNRSTSILEKLFGSSLALNGSGSSSFTERNDVEEEATWSPLAVRSSKFAQWFPEEDERTVDHLSSNKANDLLSLISGGKNGGSLVVDTNDAEHVPSSFPFQHSELADSHTMSSPVSTSAADTDRIYNTSKPKTSPAILTCEDLEQSILSEITVNDSSSPLPFRGWSDQGRNEVQKPEANVDNHASQHLLSLLQTGMGPSDMAPSASLGMGPNDMAPSASFGFISLDEQQNSRVANLGTIRESDPECIHSSGKPLTLETLFGSAFMKELQSVGAPSSEQGDSLDSAKFDVLMSGNSSSVSKQLPIKSDMIEEHLLGLDPQVIKSDPLQPQTEFESRHGGFEGSEIQLPVNNNLISGTGSLNNRNLMSGGNSAKPELLSNLGVSADTRGSDVPYHNFHIQSSRSNQIGPLFQASNSHPANIHAQMKVTSPENLSHHNASTTNHQYSTNMVLPPFHHPSIGMTSIDPNARTAMLQQMQMPGNFPLPHSLHAFPGVGHAPPHPSNQVTDFVQDASPIPGFPFGQRQPNFDGPGLQQGLDVGGEANHPEALRRLIQMEMELRSNPKQQYPLATASHPQGMYGHQLNMGFGFR